MFFKENTTASGQLRPGHTLQETEVLSGRGVQDPPAKAVAPQLQGTGKAQGSRGAAALALPLPPLSSNPAFTFGMLSPHPFPTGRVQGDGFCLPLAQLPWGLSLLVPPLASPHTGRVKWFSPRVTSPFSWLCFPCRILYLLIYLLCFGHMYSHGFPCALHLLHTNCFLFF